MNVSLKNIDATKGIVKLEIVKADYADKVEKSLRSFRQKAEMPGFRKGMVPMGMVKKMYGKHVLVEEINKLVSENLYNYTGKRFSERRRYRCWRGCFDADVHKGWSWKS